ncbi:MULTISPECIES: DMT family transporter [unclassified Agrococcus]|uniref:DMT family transporter n=1 Tax=unclassified Agrococcus TaxID=2615065 RepID=UPI00361F6298
MRLVWVLAAFVGGMAMAAQSRINGELAVRVGDGIAAALVSFGVGLALVGSLTIALPSGRAGAARMLAALREGRLRWWYALTGLFGAVVVASQGLAVPTLGVALFTVGIVAGQTLSGILVDRMGIGVLAAKRVTPQRVLGALVTIAAVATGAAAGGFASSSILLVLLPLVAGMLIALQQAFAGQVQHHTRSALTQTTSNFLVGTLALALVVVVRVAGGLELQPLPVEWWLYLGGPLGCLFIAVAAVAVHRIGVLALGLASIAGQVVMALVLDLVAPTAGHPVSVLSYVGAGLAIAGVAVSTMRRRPRPA